MTLIRPLTEEDRPLIEGWISNEHAHQNNTFEFYQAPKTKTVIYEDSEGPVFAVRYSSALRIDMEFNPEASPKRVGRLMAREFPVVEEQARQQGFTEVIFDSIMVKLTQFCGKLGFSKANDWRKVL